MRLLCMTRKKVSSSRLLPDDRALRSVQGPHQIQLENGEWRVSSAAFLRSTADAAVSVDLEQLLRRDGLPPHALYPAVPNSVALAGLPVGVARNHGTEVEHHPIRSNWYHGGITGEALAKPAVRKKLAKACHFVIPVDRGEATTLENRRRAILGKELLSEPDNQTST
jgi:hypothetical protein